MLDNKIGRRFNLLLVVGRAPSRVYFNSALGRNKKRTFWQCQCACGNFVEVAANALASGLTKSCGCLTKKGNKTAVHPVINQMYGMYKSRADKRGLVFDLSRDHFCALATQNCHYCGHPPTVRPYLNKGMHGDVAVNGVDRRRSDLGYIPENCVPCCAVCNMAKGTLEPEEFVDMATRVHDHNDLDSHTLTVTDFKRLYPEAA